MDKPRLEYASQSKTAVLIKRGIFITQTKKEQAMIAIQGYYDYKAGKRDGTDLNASAI